MKRTKAPKEPACEDESLREVMYPVILQAIKDTSLWLSTKAQVEEKVYIRRAQARLNELARICEQDRGLRPPPQTNKEWNQAAAEVLSLVRKAAEDRKPIVGDGLHRLVELLAPPTKGGKQLRKQAEVRRNKVDEFIRLVLQETGEVVTRKDISLAAGYKDETEFERYQADHRATVTATSNFDQLLNMDPTQFVHRLESRKRKNNRD